MSEDAARGLDELINWGSEPELNPMCTHVATCCIAINADGAVFSDTDALWTAMQQSLEQVLALGKQGRAGRRQHQLIR